ncbi:Beta-hexosaminidase [Clostridiaceae bacterium JG1575]|nr:Beta-hexosaminidase [Clostridiaceae bacterium JG1575]
MHQLLKRRPRPLLICCLTPFLFTACSFFGGAPATGAPPIPKPPATVATNSLPQTKPVPHPATQPSASLLDGLSLQARIRLMLMVRYESLPPGDAAREYGGYMFFAPFFEGQTPEGVQKTLKKLNESVKTPYGMLFAVDEEGGPVTRVSKFSQYGHDQFRAPGSIYRAGGTAALQEDANEKGALLRSLGLNMNFAPVADVSLDPESFIYPRTLGVCAQKAAPAIQVLVGAQEANAVASVLKHFPGYGDSADTHEEMVRDAAPLEEVRNRWQTFRVGIEAGASGVMVSHLIVDALDPGRPASLSAKVVSMLRKELNFQGVVLTDDLDMGAIGEVTKDPAVAAIQAGNDLLLTSKPEEFLQRIEKAVAAGEISPQRINASALRVLKLREHLEKKAATLEAQP